MHNIRLVSVDGEAPSTIVPKKVARQGRSSALSGLTAVAVRREEARKTNQRREERHLNVSDWAVLTFRRKKRDVSVINVSRRGAMIETSIEPRIGEKLELQFKDCNRTQCTVRWVRGNRVGVEFGIETVIIAPSNVRELIVAGRRAGEQQQPQATNQPAKAKLLVKGERPPRHRLIWRGALHWNDGSIGVRLRNLSNEGAMLEATRDLAPETRVVLDLAGAGMVDATVRWCRSGHIGIRFNEKFDLRQLVQYDDTVSSPKMLKPEYLKTDGEADSPWSANWDRTTPENI